MTGMAMGKIFALVVGFVLLIMFFYTGRKTFLFLRKAKKAKGTIIELVYSPRMKAKGNYTPVVKFKLPSGQTVSFVSTLSSTSYAEGQEVDVLYDPGFPEDAMIKSFFGLYLVPAILFFFAAFTLFVTFYAWARMEPTAVKPLPPLPAVPAEPVQKVMFYLLYWVMPGGFALFAILPIIWGILDIKNRLAVRGWPSAEGIVLKSEVKESGRYYSPGITYTFKVGGKKFESSRFSLAEWESGNPVPSKKAVKRFPAKKKITVFYNPTNPEESVIDPGFSFTSGLILLFSGGAGFLFFAWLAYIATRSGWLK